MRAFLKKFVGFFNLEERKRREAEIKALKLELIRRRSQNVPWQDLRERLRKLQD